MYVPTPVGEKTKPKRLVNCFSFGLSEHGRLGIGPPDHQRMMAEAGCKIGWHQPQDPDTMLDTKVTNRRAHRTHVHGLARLAKIPADIPEGAVGSGGGIVLPIPVTKPLKANGPRAVSLATRDSHTLALMDNGKIYGWGNGDNGQLGVEVIKTNMFEIEEEARSRNKLVIEKVHVDCATKGRDCNVWQPALQPTLPREVQETELGNFEDPIDPPASVHCSSKASFVLTQGGKIWCWGDGSFNVLGQTLQQTNAQKLKVAEAAKKFADEEAKRRFAEDGDDDDADGGGGGGGDKKDQEEDDNASSDDGEGGSVHSASSPSHPSNNREAPIYALIDMTDNGCTQCSVPVLVGGPVSRQTVTMLACGAFHVLALTVARKVLCWGRNDHGQLGIGRVSAWETPRQVKLNATSEPVYSIAAGEKHSLAVVQLLRADLRVERTVFAWGCKDNGRLGGVGDKKTFEPQEVTSLMRIYKKFHMFGYISEVVAGRDHSAALTDSGRVITWGAGSYGQLGNGFGFDSELPCLIESVYNIVQISCGARHTLALSCFHTREKKVKSVEDLKAPPKNAEQRALYNAPLPTPPYDPFGEDDPTTKPPVFIMDEDGEPTDKVVVSRKNVIFGWGWNGFGELGTGDDLPRLSPIRIDSMLPADTMIIRAGTHHSIALTSGYAATVREDIQRAGGYGPYLRRMQEAYEHELEEDEKRLQAFQDNADDDDEEINFDSDDDSDDDNKKTEDDEGAKSKPQAKEPRAEPSELSEIGQMCLKLAAVPIKKEMEYARLDSSLLFTPQAFVPNQPGLMLDPPKPTPVVSTDASVVSDDASQNSQLQSSSLSLFKKPKQLPLKVRKWHSQEAVAPRDFSMGTYCLDTPLESDKGRWPPVRGSYQAIYSCNICKLERICMVCARLCHASHHVRVTLARKIDLQGPCDCGVPVVVEEDYTKKKKGKNKKVSGGPAAERAAKNEANSLARARALGMTQYVNRCRCQGTLERKVFDKYIDELDGCVRLRQLETMMLDMHKTEEEDEIEREYKRTGKRPTSKKPDFDMQDAREAEEQLSVLVNGIPDENVELDPLYDPLDSDEPIPYMMFHDWKKKHAELKKSRAAIELGGDETEAAAEAEVPSS